LWYQQKKIKEGKTIKIYKETKVGLNDRFRGFKTRYNIDFERIKELISKYEEIKRGFRITLLLKKFW